MIHCQLVANWKLVGSLLEISPGQLDIFENDYNNKAEKCCMVMLTHWCNVDPNASLEILKEVVGKSKSPVVNIHTSQSDMVVESIKHFLHHRYDKGRYDTRINLGLPYKPENFTNIAFIHHESSKVTEESVTVVANIIDSGNIIIDDKNVNGPSSQPLQHNDYYDRCTKGTNVIEFLYNIDSAAEEQESFLLLIEGRPGVGKTAICKEIAFEWIKNEKSDLTLLICLHEIATRDINSFDTLFDYICPGNQKTQLNNISEYLSSKFNKKVMVIIDGYEEILKDTHSNSKAFINNVIKRNILQLVNCDLVISTRCATAVLDLTQHKNIYRVELLGFTEKLQQKFFECNVNQTRSDRNVAKLRKYLNPFPFVKDLCFHPLFINFLVHLYNQLEVLPKFQTELIDKFACIMILWAQQYHKVFNMLDITISRLFEKLPEKIRSTLSKICNWAFDTLHQDIVAIESENLNDRTLVEKSNYQTGFTFFKLLENFRGKGKIYFHFSIIQEFLAAFSITKSAKDLKTLWSTTGWDHRYINVWTYYFGLSKVVPEELKSSLLSTSWFMRNERLSSKILQNKASCLYLVYCLMELPNEGIYKQSKQVVLHNEKVLDISNCKDIANGSLVLFLSYYVIRQWQQFNLSNCSLSDDKIENLLQLMMHREKHMPAIITMILSNNQLTNESVTNILGIAHILNTSNIILLHNEKVEDKIICKKLLSFIEASLNDYSLKVIENDKSLFLFCKIEFCHLQLMAALTNLYIIKCTPDGEALDNLVTALRIHQTLSLLYLYDTNLPCSALLTIFEMFKMSKHLTSVLVFEKSLSDVNLEKISNLIISANFTLLQVLLISTNKLFAQGANDYYILMALEYNPSILHLQLNNCTITNEVMSQIARALNSTQQWSLLDLSGGQIDNNTLREFSSNLDGNCVVNVIKVARNRLTSLSLIVELIQCLKPNAIDICENSFTTDDSKNAVISIFMAIKLLAYENQLHLTLKYDSGNILICHKLNNIETLTTGIGMSNVFTQVFVNDCTINSKLMMRLLDNNDLLTFLHLGHVKWIGKPLYKYTKIFERRIFFSICENSIPEEAISSFFNKFYNINVSGIISTNDIFILRKCNNGLLNWHMTQKFVPFPINKNLVYIRNCSMKNQPQNYDIISSVNNHNSVTEIMLYNNGLNQNNIQIMTTGLQKLEMPKSIFIYELHKQIDGTMDTRWLLKENTVIGKQATSEQIGWCFSLVLPTATILRLINCSLSNEHYHSLINALTNNHETAVEEFSLYECNTNDIWTKQLAEALQVKSTLTSLLFSCNRVTPLVADLIATALSTVIINNPFLEKVSFKFGNFPSLVCGKIFQALSNIKRLKHFRFCDGQVTSEEATHQLKKVLGNNSLLKIVNLKNNILRSSGVKVIAEAFKNIHHLKLLALNGNQIDEDAANDIASIIINNVEIEKLLLHNNALRSKGIFVICQALKSHKKLQVFRISQNHIQEEVADDIADVIDHNPSLQVVDVGKNRLLTRGVIKITKSLEKLTNLQKLSLNENNITCTEKAAASIARIIRNNKKLKVLNMGDNNFSTPGSSTIANALNTVTGLQELAINNTGLTADHIMAMITNNLSLEIFDIGDNKLKSEGISNISKSLIKLSHLKVLGLSGNEITDDAADDIAAVIYKLPVLEKLLLNNNLFGVVGIKSICKSLEHNGTLKLLQLNNVGITEEMADDVAAVINNNSLLVFLYLGNNRLQSFGANVILSSLNKKKNFKALALNNNNISEGVVDNIVRFVTSNPDLEELVLNNNSIGTAGVISICECVKGNSTLKVINLADNNVSDVAAVPIVSAVESNTMVEKLSLSSNTILKLNNNKLSNLIATLINLKYLQIDCKVVTEKNITELVDLVFTKSYVQEITINYLSEEIHFLSPFTKVEVLVVIKTNVNELASHMSLVHSVFIANRAEIVYTKDNELVESEVAQMIKKGFERLFLVFTKMNYYTDQEIDILTTAITVNCKSIDSLIISKLNANKYNSDVSGVVIIEGSEIIVMLTGNSLHATGITKFLNKIENITNVVLCTERMSTFTSQNITEITDIVSKTSNLIKFELRKNAIFAKAVKSYIDYLTKSITFKTVSTLNILNMRCFDFTHKGDKPAAVLQETNKHQWNNLFTMLKRNVNLKALNLSGIAINEGVEQYLSCLLNETTKLEMLSLKECSLKLSLKSIFLQNITRLKYLDLSNNFSY